MTKEDLKQYTAIKKEKKQLEEEIRHMESEELKSLYYDKVNELSKAATKIEIAISKLEPTERAICRYRYICGMKWDDISEAMHYSLSTVHDIHRKALEQLNENDIE